MPKKLTRKRVSKKKRTQKRKIQRRRQRGGNLDFSDYPQATKVGTDQPDPMTDKLSEPDSLPTLGSA